MRKCLRCETEMLEDLVLMVANGLAIDVREKGSKNAGATNTIRVLGLLPGIFVLCIDAFKGWLAIYLSRYFGMEIVNSDYMILYFSGTGNTFIKELEKRPTTYSGKRIFFIALNVMQLAIDKIKSIKEFLYLVDKR